MPDAEGENWYDWRVEHWGTKWEVNEPDFELQDDGTRIEGYFLTAYSPPLEAYGHFLAQNDGCKIEAYYCAGCDQFAGVFVNGCDEQICDEEFDAPPEKRGIVWHLADHHIGLLSYTSYDPENDDEDDDEDEDEDE